VILRDGACGYRDFGQARSRGTLPLQLAGNVRHGGLIERAFDLTVRELIEEYGWHGQWRRCAQCRSAAPRAYLPVSQLDTPLEYEALAAAGGLLGHGGVVVFDDTVDMLQMARYAMEFCA